MAKKKESSKSTSKSTSKSGRAKTASKSTSKSSRTKKADSKSTSKSGRAKKTDSKSTSKSGRSKTASKSSRTKKVDPDAPLTKSPYSDAFLQKMKKKILRMREMISDNIESGMMELQDMESHHLADTENLASDSTDDILISQILEMDSSKMQKIDKALEKIENGTYGICEISGKKINQPRLEAIPYVELCIEEQRKQEQGIYDYDD